MNKRDLLMITGIAIALLVAVSAFEVVLRGVPELPQGVPMQTADPSLSATATPAPLTAQPTQPAASGVATDSPDEAQPATPTPSG